MSFYQFLAVVLIVGCAVILGLWEFFKTMEKIHNNEKWTKSAILCGLLLMIPAILSVLTGF